jgi:outer membrane protease
LLKNNFIRIIDHSALPSIQNLEELTYCKWHNSFDHNTSNYNMFCRVIQSAIDNGRLRFSEAQQMDQLDLIGLDGKYVLNRIAIHDSLKAQGSNAQERDVEPSSEDKVVVHELQIEDTQEDSNVIIVSEDIGGR